MPKKHLFLCSDQRNPKCCSHEEGMRSWNYLKKRITELGLKTKVRRSKTHCLQVCEKGPVMVIYPEETWHLGCTPEKIEQILQELQSPPEESI
ncbi:MAG: (2Fe-2S) ferredoxin domain-containing protein [Myxococcaceae bacterium]|nr:(2Fe-2S) ferredoxin domain-containing protein [Myxococcaceae bacterium]